MRRGLAAAVAGAAVLLSASASGASTTEAPERVSAHGEVVLSGTIDEEPSPASRANRGRASRSCA